MITETKLYLTDAMRIDGLRKENARAWAEVERLRSDFRALQYALVGDTGLSAIQEAHRLRALHPLCAVGDRDTRATSTERA